MIKNGMIAVAGRAKGLWNKETKSFEVKRGKSANGNKYQIFEIAVSSKDKDGNYTNGKGLKVMITGGTKIEHNQEVGILGFLKPDNYTNKEGKEIQGLMLTAKCEDMFTPLAWEKKEPEIVYEQVKKEEDVW